MYHNHDRLLENSSRNRLNLLNPFLEYEYLSEL